MFLSERIVLKDLLQKQSYFYFSFFLSERIVLKDLLQNRRKNCLQASVCTFRPGNFTGWVIEGVKENGPRQSSLEHKGDASSGPG